MKFIMYGVNVFVTIQRYFIFECFYPLRECPLVPTKKKKLEKDIGKKLLDAHDNNIAVHVRQIGLVWRTKHWRVQHRVRRAE